MTPPLQASEEADLVSQPIDDKRECARRIVDVRLGKVRKDREDLNVHLRKHEQALADYQKQREELIAATHQPPTPPFWRAARFPERPGAPLYLLIDFRESVTDWKGPIEAALESAGLLDAWITPSGQVLDRNTFDVVLKPNPLADADQTLLDLLRPIDASDVPSDIVESILKTVAVIAPEESDGSHECWMSLDGRWKVGPLHGSWTKPEPVFIGTSARERERIIRLQRVDKLIAETEATLSGIEDAISKNLEYENRLEVLFLGFPRSAGLMSALKDVQTAARLLDEARRIVPSIDEQVKVAETEMRQALFARDKLASQYEVVKWLGAIEDLREHSRKYFDGANELVHETRELIRLRNRNVVLTEDFQSQKRRMEDVQIESDELNLRARNSRLKANELAKTVGVEHAILLEQLRELGQRETTLDAALPSLRNELLALGRLVGEKNRAQKELSEGVESFHEARKNAENLFRAFVAHGFLRVLDVAIEKPLDDWTFTDALQMARRVDSLVQSPDCSPSAKENSEDGLAKKHRELIANIPVDIRVLPERLERVLVYQCSRNGRSLRIHELLEDIEQDLTTRTRLLDDQERRLFESFLSGEMHEHLSARVRQANTLIDLMNSQLEAHPTKTGMQLRLFWQVGEQAPADAKAAIELLLKAGHLLTDSNREALKDFLARRLEEVRTQDGYGTLMERLAGILDYRRWFDFVVKYRKPGYDWKILTKKSHGAGSGGQKAVMLHLPLFAAAAAFYASASQDCAKLIMLDEVFAGIDRPTRSQLMSLLSEFDLDFMMTSFEEWGFYEELDGISTYHLARETGLNGVYSERFIWDGRMAVQVEQ